MTYPYFASRLDWPWLVRPSGRSVIGQSVISLALNSRPRTQPRTMSSTVYETLTQSSNYAAYLSKAITVARSQVLSDMEKEIVDNIGSFRRYAYEADWGSTFPACRRQIPAMVLATGGAVVLFVYGRCHF